MDLTPHELVTLAGLLRFVMRFDALPDEARRSALEEASRELGLHAANVRLVEDARAGYRDAARVVEIVSTGLDTWLERAAREVPDGETLRARAAEVQARSTRIAMLRAVETLARREGLQRQERLFLGWLASFWFVPSVLSDDDRE
jgi:hypothetical protein